MFYSIHVLRRSTLTKHLIAFVINITLSTAIKMYFRERLPPVDTYCALLPINSPLGLRDQFPQIAVV
ncbi:MAG: hypothetical protein QOF14_4666 [Hyphomicrobiales bacterium]|nr:hypothetical protein [Hyphomicrobiales bacterium]